MRDLLEQLEQIDLSNKSKSTMIATALQELWDWEENPPELTKELADEINTVWVFSAPGTVTYVPTIEEAGVYGGGEVSSDYVNIMHGAQLVIQITALRLGKNPDQVTKQDITDHGPLLYYNGEDPSTVGTRHKQNCALKDLIDSGEFPIPASNIKIDHIHIAHSPAQVEGFAKYAQDHDVGKKVAVVSIGAHFLRVGRYLEHAKDILPKGVEFLNFAALQLHNPIRTTLLELLKMLIYLAKGDLAEESIFNK